MRSLSVTSARSEPLLLQMTLQSFSIKVISSNRLFLPSDAACKAHHTSMTRYLVPAQKNLQLMKSDNQNAHEVCSGCALRTLG